MSNYYSDQGLAQRSYSISIGAALEDPRLDVLLAQDADYYSAYADHYSVTEELRGSRWTPISIYGHMDG